MAIAMTTPVMNHVAHERRKEVFTVSFYVPVKYQQPNAPPPKPSDPKVFLDHVPSIEVGVIAFDGFEREREDQREEEELTKVLDKAGIKYDSDEWWFAGYDPPFRLTGRHNEVWVKIQGQGEQ